MKKLIWDKSGDRFYEIGIDRGVLYPVDVGGEYLNGVVWNGLVGITENPSGVEAESFYMDGSKYFSLLSTEEFSATIEALTYPKEFELCDGSVLLAPGFRIAQQSRKPFGLAYRTIIGNDTNGQNYGYKLHLIYGCLALPSEKDYQSINESSDVITFSWEVNTTPIDVLNNKPTSALTIDSREVDPVGLAELEDVLYGVINPTLVEPRLPLPSEIVDIVTLLRIFIVGTSKVGRSRIIVES